MTRYTCTFCESQPFPRASSITPGGERPPQIPGRKSPTHHCLIFPDGPRSAISKGQGSADKGWLLLHVKKSILNKHSPRDQGGAMDLLEGAGLQLPGPALLHLAPVFGVPSDATLGQTDHTHTLCCSLLMDRKLEVGFFLPMATRVVAGPEEEEAGWVGREAGVLSHSWDQLPCLPGTCCPECSSGLAVYEARHLCPLRFEPLRRGRGLEQSEEGNTAYSFPGCGAAPLSQPTRGCRGHGPAPACPSTFAAFTRVDVSGSEQGCFLV